MTGKKAVLFGAGAIVLIVLVVKTVYFLVDLFQPNRLPSQDWAIFQENFISPEGRVIDTGNANVSHSEGQGYGLIIAEAYGDRPAFDRIWEWTQKNLQTRPDDKLLSWQWKPDGQAGGGAVSDPNNASDGDLLVAWALVRAHRQWGDYKYQQAAAQILTDLAKLNVIDLRDDGLVFIPGTVGFVQDGIFTLNLSYYVFPAFHELAAAFPSSPWQQLDKSGLALVTKASFGQYGLTPDWIQLAGTVVPAAPAVTVLPAEASVASPTPANASTPEPAAAQEAIAQAIPPVSEVAEPASTPEAVASAAPEEPVAAPTPAASVEPLAKAGKVEVSSKFPPDFGYNAVRIPLHIAWQDPRSPELIPYANFWKQFPADKLPATVNVVTGVVGPDPALPGMQAIAALTIACVDKRDLTVRSLPVLTKGEPYFSASLSILTKIAVRELFAK